MNRKHLNHDPVEHLDDVISIVPITVNSSQSVNSSNRPTASLGDDGAGDGSESTRFNETHRADVPIPTVPPRVGRFVIKEELGRGGFGVVHKAYDTVLDREVAIKAISRLRGALGNDERRLHEARATAKMSHPYLVPLYEIIEEGDCIYLVSELCPGPTLRRFISAHPGGIEPAWAITIATKLAQAIAHAHQRGFVHRDIKPSNVLLVPDPGRNAATLPAKNGEANSVGGPTLAADDESFDSLVRSERLPFTPRLTDFGLVRDIVDSIQSHEGNRIVGTLSYIAPEQLTHEAGDAPPELKLGDVYSMGVVIYQMLAGCVPFKGKYPIELIELMSKSAATPLRDRNPNIDRDLDAICMKCLEREPSRRYASIEELGDDLERYAEDFPVRARPRSRSERMLQTLRRSPVESTLVFCLLLMSTIAAATFAWSNRSLRQKSETLAGAIAVASHNERVAKDAETRASVALREAEQERLNAEASENAALEIAYQSDLRQAFAAVAAGNTANSQQIADEVLDYCGVERVNDRFDWRLLQTFTRDGWRQLELGSETGQARVTETVLIPQRDLVVSSSLDGWIRIHDRRDGRLVNSWQLPRQSLFGFGGYVQVNALAASPDGRWIAVGKATSATLASWSGLNTVELIEIPDDHCAELSVHESFTGFDATVESLVFTPDSKQLAVGCRYEPIRVITIDDPAKRFELSSERRNEEMLFNSKGELVLCPVLGEISAYDLGTRERRVVFKNDSSSAAGMVKATKDSTLYCCACVSHPFVYFCDLQDGDPVRYKLNCSRGAVSRIALTGDGEHLVIGTVSGGVGVWNVDELDRLKRRAIKRGENQPITLECDPVRYQVRHRGAVTALSIDESGQIYSGGDDGVIVVSHRSGAADVTDRTGGRVASTGEYPTMMDKTIVCVGTHEGRSVFGMRRNGSVFRITPEDGEIVEELPITQHSSASLDFPSSLTVSEANDWLIAGYNSFVRIKELSGAKRVFEIHLPEQEPGRHAYRGVEAVILDPQRSRMVLREGSNVLHSYRIDCNEADGSPHFKHENSIRTRRSAHAILMTQDGDLMLFGDTMCHYRSGDVAETVLGPGFDHIRAVCKDSREGRFLIGSLDGRIYALDERGQPINRSRQWRSGSDGNDQHCDITSLALSPDQRTVLSGSSTGELGIWNASNLRLLGSVRLIPEERAIRHLSISAGNEVLMFNDWPNDSTVPDDECSLHVIPLAAD